MSDPRVVDPGHAPTPFTADEIRRGCPTGRQVTVAHVAPDGSSEFWTTTFARTDDETAVIINQHVDEAGQPLGAASELVATWDELQAHASFPADSTSITEEELSIPIGRLACLRYLVTEGGNTKTLWFARSLPGLPVKTIYSEEGATRLTTVVVRDSQADPPDYPD